MAKRAGRSRATPIQGTMKGSTAKRGGSRRRSAKQSVGNDAVSRTEEHQEIPISTFEEVESVTDRARRDAQSMVGEELPGGTVAVPDNDRVDEFAAALGVERTLNAPVRTSTEILEGRDRRRGGRKPPPTL
jgi:hypothetical protein